MKIRFYRDFKKAYKKAPKKVQAKFQKRLELFLNNPKHPLLRNHSLSGQYQSYRSINVGGDWRAIYYEVNENEVVFVDLGTHGQLYG